MQIQASSNQEAHYMKCYTPVEGVESGLECMGDAGLQLEPESIQVTRTSRLQPGE